jgi:hypothetical protein
MISKIHRYKKDGKVGHYVALVEREDGSIGWVSSVQDEEHFLSFNDMIKLLSKENLFSLTEFMTQGTESKNLDDVENIYQRDLLTLLFI